MADVHAFRSSRAEVAPPVTLFLFGAHGDLVKRLLVPSLYNLTRDGLLDGALRIVGVDHNTISDKAYREKLGMFLQAHSAPEDTAENEEIPSIDPALWRKLAARISYLKGDFLSASTYTAIASCIAALNTRNAVFYLATAPRFFCDIIKHLAQAGLLQETEGQFRRVIIEKPFGSDLRTAQELNAGILSVMDERQVYRIDHYLGKETVQNILVSRFANGLFEAFWNNHYIDHVQITAAETIGVEQRSNFYERTGALRDMVPNHLFQLLAMIAMEPPAAFNADAVRDEKTKVIAAIRPQTSQEALRNAVLGQYVSGMSCGHQVPGYREEPHVAPDSRTETYVALKLWVDNWRWADVPFYLRTGKRMRVRNTEIAICFKPAPMSPFRDTQVDRMRPNYLIIQIQPDEGMWFDFQAKRPGTPLKIENVQMGFSYADFFSRRPSTGYETLLYDAMIGDQTLFQRADNIENGWRVVQPFLDVLEKGDVQSYAAGTDGPEAAHELLRRDRRAWRH
jgi:glucose-6-phosphate 1-dehydrogenase